ncbi:hypothetical protein TKK_0000910 [Trichogramma kaykai]|uniref:Vitellogenin domain-containing protein n=1 Tax=Trichogramma kaykai TaxID=54128 RepID=A0ABD2VW05_9HYME
MIVILVPFFLAAQLREAGWPQGAGEALYRFSVNATVLDAAAATGSYHPSHQHDSGPVDRSTRFDLSSQLRCRFRGPASLVCRMCDTRAVSFASKDLNPASQACPMPDTLQHHAEYQIAEEAFEISFAHQGVAKILVNRTVSPHDLNIIRALVNQFNVGANIAKRRETEFHQMEKSLIGKCDTMFRVVKNTSSSGINAVDTGRMSTVAQQYEMPRRGANANCSITCKDKQQQQQLNGGRVSASAGKASSTTATTDGGDGGNGPWLDEDYKLSGLESLGRRKGETLRLEKWRNVHKCSLRADYFFGSRENLRMDPSDFEARIVASESTIHVSDTNFASYTANEVHIKRQRGDDLVIYERYALQLASIDATTNVARRPPFGVADPASASVYAYQYIDDEDEESLELAPQPTTQKSHQQQHNKRSRATRRSKHSATRA